MNDYLGVLTIILMAITTYLTRVLAYIGFRNRQLSPTFLSVLESVPGCVLISVIAPAFVDSNPANLVALAVTILLATKYSILPTVLISVAVTALLRHMVGS